MALIGNGLTRGAILDTYPGLSCGLIVAAGKRERHGHDVLKFSKQLIFRKREK